MVKEERTGFRLEDLIFEADVYKRQPLYSTRHCGVVTAAATFHPQHVSVRSQSALYGFTAHLPLSAMSVASNEFQSFFTSYQFTFV